MHFEGVLDKQLSIAVNLVTDSDELEHHLENLDYLADRGLYLRLNNWLCFLNESFWLCRGAYSHLISSVIIAAKENQTFRTQTGHEFELSLDFLGRVLCRKPLLNVGHLETAKFLLSIALIFGKYPGMVIRSINGSIDNVDERGSIKTMKSLFEHLFVKYETPRYLTDFLSRLEPKEIEALMFVLQGNNLRKFSSIPLPVSRKESWLIQNLVPQNLPIEDEILKRQIVAAKLVGWNNGKSTLLVDFFQNCKLFQFDLDRFVNDLDFWKRVFKMYSERDWDMALVTSGDFLDYVLSMRHLHGDDFRIGTKRPADEIYDAFEWHHGADWYDRYETENLAELRLSHWSGLGHTKSSFEMEGVEYQFGEIRNGEDLYSEADELKHCVFTYIEFCSSGQVAIFSLKKKTDAGYCRYLTVEIQGNRIVQARGRMNRDLTQQEGNLLNLIAEKFEFSNELELEEMNGEAM